MPTTICRLTPETLQELINSSFTTVAATFGNLASAEVIHEVKSQHSFVIHNRTSKYNISPLMEISKLYLAVFRPVNLSLADRRLCHTLTAEHGTDGRFGWQSAFCI